MKIRPWSYLCTCGPNACRLLFGSDMKLIQNVCAHNNSLSRCR